MRPKRLTPLLAVLFALGAGGEVEAWPREAYRDMVYDTLRLLPPRLSRVLLKRDEAILQGVSSLEGETASRLARDGLKGKPSGELVEDVQARIDRIVDLLEKRRSIEELAVEFGRLLRIAADLADPTVVGAGRPELRRVVPEYYRFVALNLRKIPLVHASALPSPLTGASIGNLLDRLATETEASVSPLSAAFWRDGRVVPAASFDFRSVPYAETSLSYSRGVTAASYLWLAAWAKANGDFTGYRFSKKP